MATSARSRLANLRIAQIPSAAPRVAGFTLLVVATLWLSFLAAGDGTLHVDVSLTRFLQDHTSTTTDVISDFGNAFGTAKVGVPIGIGFAILLIWRGHLRGSVLLLAATAMRIANYGLKDLFDSSRPTPNLARVETNLDSNGFPSGHAQGATLLCGALLIAFWLMFNRSQRVAACVVAGIVVLATCYARVSTGAHWPSDVVGGVLWGALLLTLAWLATSRIGRTSHATAHPE
jgi:membrane-associated phospholipid phosphatase